MQFIQAYLKEIVSILVPVMTWILNNKLKPKVKLQLANPHGFAFLVNEPLKDSGGNTIRERQVVYTQSHILINSGKEPATDIEMVFNRKTMCLNIWPPRHYDEHIEPDGRHILLFDTLAPSESLRFELLSINEDVPHLINARCKQCKANIIEMNSQPVSSTTKVFIAKFLIFMGAISSIYLAIIFLQLLLSN